MINENNNAVEIEIFLFLFLALQPLRAMAVLTVHAQSDWCLIASIFIYAHWVAFTESSAQAMIKIPTSSELLLYSHARCYEV